MIELKLNIPKYSKERGIIYSWEDGFTIETDIVEDQIVITANKEGLISLAKHLLFLAQDETPVGRHCHFDEYNSLETGSKELVITKI
ncbi:hypothetical protein EZ456_10495 [Pedobacter psychrodurus]|uniref:Uncharacterized protein n=1 Tax=Pedobacter psychrodurus TaxID=2530456 RepID=A0A4R0PWP9_9SPHI|nr:hypothetical protein [Pedobacter psychrodurus]TCD27164.1 hypothetical protein EZ456_10495 [Pedobacter psychrodurus]